MTATCETTCARTLSHTPGSTSPLFKGWSVLTRVHMGDPISKRGSEVSTNVRHLARQAALSKSHTRPWASALVRSRDQPSGTPFASVFPERIVHTSTKPILESLRLSLVLLLLLRSAASGDVGCFLRLFGPRMVHLSTLSPVPKPAFHSVLPVVGLVTMQHLQRALSNHCC